MGWTLLGTLQATAYWQEFSTPLTSGIIRVSYSGNIDQYPNGVRGYLRLRYGPDTYSVQWFRLYPKFYEKELYLLSAIFIPSLTSSPTLQFRKWVGFSSSVVGDWSVTVEQADLSSASGEGVPLFFGSENSILIFGPESTVFQ